MSPFVSHVHRSAGRWCRIDVTSHDAPLPIAPFKGTPEEIERQWYDEVYRGRGDSMAQLTWRAVLMGSCLGSVASSVIAGGSLMGVLLELWGTGGSILKRLLGG